MKNKKIKSNMKRGLAVTASLAILASNISLTLPAKVTFAEDISNRTVLQVNASEEQVSSPPLPKRRNNEDNDR